MSDFAQERAQENKRLLKRLAFGAVVMFGFGYLMVPFYEKICEVTGINNFMQADASPGNTQVDTSRTVAIEFDASLHGNMPWEFKPVDSSVRIHPGEMATVNYEVTNTKDVAVTGQAVPSYGPQRAGQYFLKMDCFCFEEQTLEPGETRVMPIAFLVDPEMPDDVKRITLSYTFFEIAGRQAAR